MTGRVVPHPSSPPPTPAPSSNGNGNGFDGRLRALEIQVARVDERIVAMEKAMATKAWVLGGVVLAAVIGVGLALTLIKLFG